MSPKCIAIDLDDTIIHHTNGSYDALFELFADTTVTKATITEIYEKTKRTLGFSLENFLATLEETTGHIIEKGAAKQRFKSWLSNFSTVYPDSIPAIFHWRNKKKLPIAIITSGDHAFQKQKVELLQVPHDELHIITPPNEKPEILRTLLARYGAPIFFIDDNAKELDRVRDAGITEDSVITFHIVRPIPRYPESPRYPHRTIHSLAEIDA